jgi:hypothetical protein
MFSRSERNAVNVALAESAVSAEEFASLHESLRGLRPPGLDELRGPGDEPNVTAEDFVSRADAIEDELRRTAAAGGASPITAGYFVIPLTTSQACSAIVVGMPQQGAGERLFPARAGAAALAEARLTEGAHILPRERVELVRDGTPHLVYHPGFLVPVGCKELTVVVATRRALFDETMLATVDRALADKADLSAVTRLLAQQGFAVVTRRVIEPRD